MSKLKYNGDSNIFYTDEPIAGDIEIATKEDLKEIPKLEMSIYGQVAIDFYILEGQGLSKIRSAMGIPVKEGMKAYSEIYEYLKKVLLEDKK